MLKQPIEVISSAFFLALLVSACAQIERPVQEDPKETALQEDFMQKVSIAKQVSALAFMPRIFFDRNVSSVDSQIEISYRGDDYQWPVWSVAIVLKCEDTGRDCKKTWHARMVRSPMEEGARPRSNGMRLAEAVRAALDENPSLSLGDAIDTADPDWIETNETECPALLAALDHAQSTQWISDQFGSSAGKREASIFIHADTIAIRFHRYYYDLRFWGVPGEDGPSDWATNLVESLETCWRPAGAPPPWQRYRLSKAWRPAYNITEGSDSFVIHERVEESNPD